MEAYLRKLFPNCIVSKNKLYFVTHGERALKTLELEKKIVEYVDVPKEYNLEKWGSVNKILLKEDTLYLFEENGKRMLEYSILKKRCRYFDINCDFHIQSCIAACALYENKIFVFPTFSNELIKVDLKSEVVDYIQPLCSNENYSFDRNDLVTVGTETKILKRFFVCGCQVGNIMWMFTEKFILKYDLSLESYKKFFYSNMIKKCIYAVWKNDLFYILDIDGSIYSWDIELDITEKIYVNSENYSCLYFWRIVVTDKNIWMLPCFGDEIYVVDLKSKKKTIYKSYPEDFIYYPIKGRSKYYGYCEDGENYYFAMHSANYILIIGKKNGKASWLKPIQPMLDDVIMYCGKNNNFSDLTESEFGIKGFLRILDYRLNNSEMGTEKNIGNVVWKKIK